MGDGQIAKSIYLKNMAGMKSILNMGEVKFGDRNSSGYKFFKKVVMDEIYNSMSAFFEEMEDAGVLSRCPCGTTIREGYKKCSLCNGAGYCNSELFNEFIMDAGINGNKK
jgi:hypothetical protein